MQQDKRNMALTNGSNRNFVIGTSGHIDHGKTTLVKALTGIDADRWAEEKKRGITIDIGFANYQDEEGVYFSFIDVPGHEKFIHNMLAGVAGIDAAILVIAADEGVMPQTKEHLQICNLLGIRHGLVVLTRCDLVEDPELVDLCSEEVRELIQDTFLEGTPIVKVSSVTKEGISHLKQKLADLYKQLEPQQHHKSFRLSVDRSFSVKGFGTVVTGTVTSGQLQQGDHVYQYPDGREVRIRGLQVHNEPKNTVFTGQRAAINISNISSNEIRRGDQLASPQTLLNSYMLNVNLSLLKDAPFELRNRHRIRLYLGTQEIMGRIIFLEKDKLLPGETALTQLRLEQEVSTRYGDRFIIRNFSPLFTLGGGIVIDPSPHKSRRIQAESRHRIHNLKSCDNLVKAEEVIYLQSTKGVFLQDFTVRTGLSEKQSGKVLQQLQSQQKIVCVDTANKRYIHNKHIERIGEFLSKVLSGYHKKFPEREGMKKNEISGKLSLIFNEREMDTVLKHLVKQELFLLNIQYYALPEHKKNVSKEWQDSLKLCIELINNAGFQPPRQKPLLDQLKLSKKEGIAFLKTATHNKHLIRVTDDLYYTPQRVEQIINILNGYFAKNKELTVIDFKDLLNISRKHAVDILEYFDSQQLTIRMDNYRVAGKL